MSGEYTFRDQLRDRSPAWLRTGNNEKLLYSLVVILDDLGDALVQGIKSRFPGAVDMSVLGLTGQERRLRRGLTEPETEYADRLRYWWDAHRTRGSPITLLEQLSIRYGGGFSAELLYRNGRRYSLAAAEPGEKIGAITRDSFVWDPDDTPERWARWWLLCYSDAFTTPEAAADLAVIPREWNAAHCNGKVIVLGAGAALIDYHSPHLIDQPVTVDTATAAVIIEVEGLWRTI
jgi:hypothetical protein